LKAGILYVYHDWVSSGRPRTASRWRDNCRSFRNAYDAPPDACLLDVLATSEIELASDAADAVGLEAHGLPLAKLTHRMTALVPHWLAERLMAKAGSPHEVVRGDRIGPSGRHDLRDGCTAG
jgi:hypothetical protein